MQKAYSISTLEQQLSRIKQNGLKSKAQKSTYNQIKQQLNQLYAETKNQIMEFEKTNYSYLALMRSTHGFYKLFGHSALFYQYSLAPKLNLKANLQTDGDFTAKSEEGFISIRKPDKLAEILATLKIQRVRTKNQTGDIILFKLPWTFTDAQIAEFVDNNHLKMRHFNHIVLVDNIIPVLFIQLEELLKAIYENVRGMSGPTERETFGYPLVKQTTAMLHLYLDLTNGLLSRDACFKQLKSKLNYIKYQTKLVTDLKIWQPKTCARIGDIIVKLQEIIIRESKQP